MTKVSNTRKMFNVLTTADTSAIRTGTYNGREYRIIPLVAIVEGVLHSANADYPELALASEFGKHPQGWNGRPVVMNHPQVNGEFVSAGSPSILEDWSYGLLFNTTLEGNKLKTEAWLDVEKINTEGGEILEILERIESGALIEVSTGLYASVEGLSGRFNNTEYEGIWRSISADHLAILSEGTIGACSIEDGCGIPRLNNIRQSAPTNSNTNCEDGCTDCEECRQKNQESTMTKVNKTTLKVEKQKLFLEELFTNAVPANMPVDSIRTLLRSALSERFPEDLYTVHTFTSNDVVFELWSSMDKFSLGFSISDSDVVSLSEDEPTKVNIISRIVAALDGSDIIPASTEAPTLEEETDMSKTPKPNSDALPEDVTEEVTTGEEVVTPETPVVAEAVTEASTQTVDEYLAAAPEGIRDSLQSGMRMHAARKAELVEGLFANERNAFSKEALEGFDMDMLANMAKLAKLPSFQGSDGAEPITNATNNEVPAPLQAFPLKAVS